jgi:fructose-1,6-bisphosphatase II / sedoheptulose-1,7-bisphosphatase
MAMAEGSTLLNAPDVYMQKVAIGPGYAKGVVELDAPADNIRRLARAKGFCHAFWEGHGSHRQGRAPPA